MAITVRDVFVLSASLPHSAAGRRVFNVNIADEHAELLSPWLISKNECCLSLLQPVNIIFANHRASRYRVIVGPKRSLLQTH